MDRARLIVLLEETEGYFLFRFSATKAFAGDTWHANLDDALHQADAEYGDSIQKWTPIPLDVDDPIAYALAAGLGEKQRF